MNCEAGCEEDLTKRERPVWARISKQIERSLGEEREDDSWITEGTNLISFLFVGLLFPEFPLASGTCDGALLPTSTVEPEKETRLFITRAVVCSTRGGKYFALFVWSRAEAVESRLSQLPLGSLFLHPGPHQNRPFTNSTALAKYIYLLGLGTCPRR